MEHFDEELELYALGMLEPADRDRVDEHVRTGEGCAQRLGRAESAVTTLVTGTQRRRRTLRLPTWPAAIAAAFALTSAVLFQQNVSLRAAVATDGHVLDALVLSHFDHVPFTATTPTTVAAKVIYEQHGKWYQIIAERAPNWSVTVTRADGVVQKIDARPERRGTASLVTLYALGPVRSIELLDGEGKSFAHARPALATDKE